MTVEVDPVDLLPGDELFSGGVVICKPYDHETYVSVVVRFSNREVRIQSWDKGFAPIKVVARGQEG